MNKTKVLGTEHLASAKAQNIPVSTKHSVEISRHLRYKKTSFAKSFLEDVIRLKKAVPYYRFDQDLGHKAGMSAGRFPQKAAREFLRLVKSVEANAQSKGLNSSALKITKVLANKASIPLTGGRHRRGTKRTHLEIEVREISEKKEKREAAVDKSKSEQPKSEHKKAVSVVSEKVPEMVKVVHKNLAVKHEEAHQIIPEHKAETKVVKKAETYSEIVSKTEKTETKTDYNFQAKPQVNSQFKSPSLSEKKSDIEAKRLNTEVKSTEVKSTEKNMSPHPNINLKVRKIEEPSPAELLRRSQERAAQLNKHQRDEQNRVKEVNEVENLFDQLKQKGSLRDQTGGKKR